MSSGNSPQHRLGDANTAGNYGYIQWDSAKDLIQLGTEAGGIVLSVAESARVGIGTTAPEKLLHVQNSTITTTTMAEFENLGSGDASIVFSISGDSYAMGIDNSTDSFQIAYAAGAGTAVLGTAVRFIVEPGGDVGIGTTNPAQTFHVNESSTGAIGIRISNANTGTGADTIVQYYSNSQTFTTGINAASDRWEIADSTVLGSLPRFYVDSAGKV